MMTYEKLLEQTALEDDRFIVMTAENRALVRNLPQSLGPRFIDTGITEQTMIGAAAGLALRGRKPVVHALSAFLTMRAFEFTRTSVGIAHLPVKYSSFIPGVLSDGNGPTHQALEDVSIMRGIPGMEVFAPADEEDLVAMLPSIWATENPSYVRINTKPSIIKHKPYEFGKAELIFEGVDFTILTYGFMLENCIKAHQLLSDLGYKVGLVNMRNLKPFDGDLIQTILPKTGRFITVEDHFMSGGLFSILAEFLVKNELHIPVSSIAFDEKWFRPGTLQDVIENEGLSPEKLVDRIEKFILNV